MDNETNGADQRRRRTVTAAAGVAVLALVAAACGSTADTTASQASETESTDTVTPVSGSDGTEAPSVEPDASGESEPADLSNYPNVTVRDVTSGDDVELAGLISSYDRPVLLWFWAPH